MLSKYMVQSLKDLALEQLPGTKALSKKLYIEHGDSRAALQAVAWAPTLLINSPLSTTLEVLAGRLLALVGQHPCTHTEYLIEKMDGDDGLCISVENAVLWAEQDRPYIEEALLETARQLCEISGANLPPWMNAIDEQFAHQQGRHLIEQAVKDGELSLINYGSKLPTQSAPALPADTVTAPVVTHFTKGTRTDALTPVIKRAQSQCENPDDVALVWTQLEKLAGEKYGPLVQMTQGELTYSEGGEAQTITREAISKRIKRAAANRH